MALAAIHIEDLSFQYSGQTNLCLNKVNLSIAEGERFGLLGPNGAGKTTLMNLMTGLLSYEVGSVKLLGNEIKNNRSLVRRFFGLVPQDFSFYQELSPVENLEFFGAWSGLNNREIKVRINELLDVLGLEQVRDKQVKKFSGGMKRRVNLAIGVIHNPKILFLDEPTVGVDVQSRQAIISYLKELNSKGTTLIYTSHQLSEAEQLCDKIALIDEGEIKVCDHLSNLLSNYHANDLEGLFISLTGKSFRDS